MPRVFIQTAFFTSPTSPELETLMATVAQFKTELDKSKATTAQTLKTLEKVTREYQQALQNIEALTDENTELKAQITDGQIPDSLLDDLSAHTKAVTEVDTQAVILDSLGVDLPDAPVPAPAPTPVA